ncbi:MAG: hypothetical protein JW795_03465 [Chitinivibrionales bacterium]|nr:hypothetical protein [Chitinivibrionales bacterium]
MKRKCDSGRIVLWYSIILCFGYNSFMPTSVDAIPTASSVIIAATAEIHATLSASNKMLGNGGGLDRLIQWHHRIVQQDTNYLFVDAGGFAAGGIYDLYTEGRMRDSIRTLLALVGMNSIKYSAIAVGDEELQFGGDWIAKQARILKLPLLSANCFDQAGKLLFDPSVIILKNGKRFAITSVMTQERLFPYDGSCIIAEPVASLQKIWSGLVASSDYQIILSHCGEDMNGQLLSAFPECDIIVNGHRKNSITPTNTVDSTVILYFGFQAAAFSSCTCSVTSRLVKPAGEQWITITDSLQPDSSLTLLNSAFAADTTLPRKKVYDLYLMSRCPYGIPVLKSMLSLAERFPSVDLNVWFIGDFMKSDSMKTYIVHSLHGDEEVAEEKLWLAVQALYPNYWNLFLYLCATARLPAVDAVVKLRLDTIELNQWIKTYATDLLVEHYRRSNRLGVSASPTLFINNKNFNNPLSRLRIAKELCTEQNVNQRQNICDSIPECFVDGECRKKGFVGVCELPRDSSQKNGSTAEISDEMASEYGRRCSYFEDAAFDVTVILSDSMLTYPHEQIINRMIELFPKATIQRISARSPRGSQIINKLNPKGLPVFLMQKEIEKAYNFQKIKDDLIPVEKWYGFKTSLLKKHYFYRRELLPGSIRLFIDPLFSDLSKILQTFFLYLPENSIQVSPLVFEFKKEVTQDDSLQIQMAALWLNKQKESHQSFIQFLKHYPELLDSLSVFKNRNSTRKAIDSENQKLLKDASTLVTNLQISSPVALLIDNREVIPISHTMQLRTILKQIAPRLK